MKSEEFQYSKFLNIILKFCNTTKYKRSYKKKERKEQLSYLLYLTYITKKKKIFYVILVHQLSEKNKIPIYNHYMIQSSFAAKRTDQIQRYLKKEEPSFLSNLSRAALNPCKHIRSFIDPANFRQSPLGDPSTSPFRNCPCRS